MGHRAMIYVFSGMLILHYVAVIAIMTRKAAKLRKIQPWVGAVYESLNIEGHWFARFYPVWFMTKRMGYVFVVYYFNYSTGMIMALIHIYLAEILAVLHTLP